MDMNNFPAALSVRDTAARIGVCTETLRNWRKSGIGPPYVDLVGRIVYRAAEVDAWLDSRTVQPESVA